MHAHAQAGNDTSAKDADPIMIGPAMEMLERLANRRSAPLRGLVEPGPTGEELACMLRLAARVPDHGRLVPWRFIVVAGEQRHELGQRLDELYARQNPDLPAGKADMWTLYMMRAPLTVVLVCHPNREVKVPEWNQVLSAGAAGMALTTAACALGFSTQWLLKWPGRDPDAAALLGLADGERVAGFIHIGRPVREAEDRPRPLLENIVTHWQADQAISNETP